MNIDEREEQIKKLQQQLIDHLDNGSVSGTSSTEVWLRNRIDQLRRAQEIAKQMESGR